MFDAIRRRLLQPALIPLSAMLMFGPFAGPASAADEEEGGDAICVVIDVSDTIWNFGPVVAHPFSCGCDRSIVTSGQVGRVVIQVVDCPDPASSEGQQEEGEPTP